MRGFIGSSSTKKRRKPTTPAAPRAPGLVWNGGGGVDRDVPSPEGLNHAERRKWRLGLEREARKYERRRIQRRLKPISEADMPAGSLLSDDTLAAITAGEYGFQLPGPRPTPPRQTYAQKLKQRRKANKLKRPPQFTGFPGGSK